MSPVLAPIQGMRVEKIKASLTGMLICLCGHVHAADFLSFGGVSRHFECDLGYNETNYGIGYERDWRDDIPFSGSVYKNSIRRATFYFLGNYHPLELGAGFRAGLSGGS